ncbi:MAG: hypothetical protein WCH11_03750 [Bdellovibrio sp.]
MPRRKHPNNTPIQQKPQNSGRVSRKINWTLLAVSVGSLWFPSFSQARSEDRKNSSISEASSIKTSAKEGLDKLRTNVENSKANLQEYQSQLKVVETNIEEVLKARAQVEYQNQQLQVAQKEKLEQLHLLEQQSKSLQTFMAEEQKLIAQEGESIEDLERQIRQLRENQEKRKQLIVQYQEQERLLETQSQKWKLRGEELQKNQGRIHSRLQSVSSQEKEWRNKKRGYEGEITRWQKELIRNQKLFSDAENLADL